MAATFTVLLAIAVVHGAGKYSSAIAVRLSVAAVLLTAATLPILFTSSEAAVAEVAASIGARAGHGRSGCLPLTCF